MNNSYRESLTKDEKSKIFSVKTRQTCQCGKTLPPGPMKRHTNSSGHEVQA
jgi:hypothetical protein